MIAAPAEMEIINLEKAISDPTTIFYLFQIENVWTVN